jgi:hypothetical protein
VHISGPTLNLPSPGRPENLHFIGIPAMLQDAARCAGSRARDWKGTGVFLEKAGRASLMDGIPKQGVGHGTP